MEDTTAVKRNFSALVNENEDYSSPRNLSALVNGNEDYSSPRVIDNSGNIRVTVKNDTSRMDTLQNEGIQRIHKDDRVHIN